MPALLEVRALSYAFPQCDPVLKEVDLELQEGCFTLLAGRNGSGKTLLMNHLNGLVKIQQGDILFKGESIADQKDIRQRIALVFQNADSQFVAPSVEREIAFGPSNLRLPKAEILERRDRIIQQFGLEAFRQRNPHSLSGGEKRRVAIASVLAMEPELVVLDEPFTGLDLPGVDQVLRCLLDLHRRGTSILLITHDLEKCLAHADRVLVLDKGVIADQGEAEEILPRLDRWDLYSPWQENRPLESYTWLRKSGKS